MLARSLLALAFALLSTIARAAPNVVSAYYPSYSDRLDVETLPYERYTHLFYFVFTTTADPLQLSTAGISEDVIYRFVELCHEHGTQAVMTVGGWTGSNYFSPNVATAQNRATFANTMVATMEKYGFDGVDIDWEYPSQDSGYPGMQWSPQDTDNYILFLSTLRNIRPEMIITLDVAISGITGADGARLGDYSGFAQYVDWINVMAYDISGSWLRDNNGNPVTGPNAPLSAKCTPSYEPWSVESAFTLYTSGGFSSQQIVMGLPAYAYTYTLTSAPVDISVCPRVPTRLFQPYTGSVGQILFQDMVAGLYFVGRANQWEKAVYDRQAVVASIYNPNTKGFIPYDDSYTTRRKGAYCAEVNCRGMAMFDLSGDVPGRLTLAYSMASSLGVNPSQYRMRLRKRFPTIYGAVSAADHWENM